MEWSEKLTRGEIALFWFRFGPPSFCIITVGLHLAPCGSWGRESSIRISLSFFPSQLVPDSSQFRHRLKQKTERESEREREGGGRREGGRYVFVWGSRHFGVESSLKRGEGWGVEGRGGARVRGVGDVAAAFRCVCTDWPPQLAAGWAWRRAKRKTPLIGWPRSRT